MHPVSSHRRTRLRAFFVLVALGALLAGGCATSSDSTVEVGTGEPASFAAAVERSAQASSGRFEMTMDMDMGFMPMRAVGEGRWSGDVTETSMSMDAGPMLGSMTIAIIERGTEVWMRFDDGGELASMLGVDPGVWLYVDAAEFAEADEALAALGANQGTDPTAFFELLQVASDDFAVTGESEVRGVPTTVWAGSVSLGAILDASLDEETRERILGLSGAGDLGLGSLEAQALEGFVYDVEVHIDSEGLVRSIIVDVDFGQLFDSFAHDDPEFRAAMGGMEMSMRIATEFFDYGDDIRIDLPDPADTVDAVEWMEQMSFEVEERFEPVGEAIFAD